MFIAALPPVCSVYVYEADVRTYHAQFHISEEGVWIVDFEIERMLEYPYLLKLDGTGEVSVNGESVSGEEITPYLHTGTNEIQLIPTSSIHFLSVTIDFPNPLRKS